MISRLPLVWTLLICGAILVLRRPDLLQSPQFWAEDGLIFFTQAYNFGATALFDPYAGYLHLLPRIVAAIAVETHPVLAPAIFVWTTFALTLYVAARTQSSRTTLPRHIVFALAVVLVPDVFEVLLFLANLQWVLAAGLLLLLVSRDPATPRQWIHDIVAAVVLGLTGPFSILFAPLFIWRALVRRTRGSIAVGAVILIVAAVQIVTIATHPVVMIGERIAPADALTVPGMRIGASLLVGSITTLVFPRTIELILSALTLIGTIALVRRAGDARVERMWLGLALAALFASTIYRCRFVLPDLSTVGFGARYFFPQQLIALWLLLASAWDRRRRVATCGIIVGLWSFAVNAPRLREPGLQDLKWAAYAERIRNGEATEIPINPDWTIKLMPRKVPGTATRPLNTPAPGSSGRGGM